MTVGWPELAEAALAIRSGALWVTANLDVTLPTERGLLPGNGAMVAALRAATDAEPLVAGKPATRLMQDALARGDFHHPLAVGDRLDTDIAGANAAGLPSLMVLTGVSTAADLIRADARLRPTYIGEDLRSLQPSADQLAAAEDPAWQVEVTASAITVTATGQLATDDLSVVRAVARAVWDDGPGRPLSPSPPPTRRPHRVAALVTARAAGSASVSGAMNTDPQQIRAEVDAALADLPPRSRCRTRLLSTSTPADGIDIDAVGRRLEHAHQILVDALESVEKG